MTDDALGREIRQMRQDIRDDFAHAREVADLKHATLEARVNALEQAAAAEAAERRTTRRWLIGAVIVPSVMMLVTVILAVWRP
ncbi:hypothetical protein [Stackebrandtia soli]|uniref:hypothetical protein n=1 Tax=Stackebrandtia soli TaxID=1892856 RepID=UPI0039E9AE57